MLDCRQPVNRLGFLLLASIRMWIVSEYCSFPKSLQGRWLESGTTSVEISSTELSNKGVCFDQLKDYYLIENRLEHCHRCLLITNRHQNVIEYQQSYCIGRQSLQSICAQIRVSSEDIFTLIREVAAPVPCPFQKPFHFIYNNNSLCYCRTPMSYLQHCADPTKMQFSFKKCRSCALTESNELTFECLAVWENGREFYAVGAFVDESSDRLTYHCFTYQLYDSVMYIVMSTEFTCQGFLRNPKEGQLTMELTEDVYGWPPAGCIFPPWLSEHSWKDLSDVMDYAFSDEHDVMFRSERRHYDVGSSSNDTSSSLPSPARSKTIFKCLKEDDDLYRSSGSIWRSFHALVQVLEKCQKSYRCLRFQFRRTEATPTLLLLQSSETVEDIGNCSAESFSHNTSRMLVRQSLERRSCPFTGRYISPIDSRGCQMELHSGCRNQSSMTLKSSCREHPDLQLYCLKWWSVQQKLFLLAGQAKQEHRQPLACYSFYAYNGSMRISVEENCDFDISASSKSVVYEFYYRLDHCLSSSDGNIHNPWMSPDPDVSTPLPLPSKIPRLVQNPDPPTDKDHRPRNSAETSARRNDLSGAASAFSAASLSVGFRLSLAPLASFIVYVSGRLESISR